MPRNLGYDLNLLEKAQKLGHFKYKKDAVNAALKEYVDKRKQTEIIELFNKLEFAPRYDHKKARRRKCYL